jgi:hypothetical protein
MSDRPEGPGWWIASDGNWYPPESHPGALPPPPPAPAYPVERVPAAVHVVEPVRVAVEKPGALPPADPTIPAFRAGGTFSVAPPPERAIDSSGLPTFVTGMPVQPTLDGLPAGYTAPGTATIAWSKGNEAGDHVLRVTPAGQKPARRHRH